MIGVAGLDRAGHPARAAGPVRGLLIAFACAGLQLAVVVQSRGWLFTLPLVAIAHAPRPPDRLRVVAAAVLPVAGDADTRASPVGRLYNASGAGRSTMPPRAPAARRWRSCAVAFFVATLVAWARTACARCRRPVPARRRALAAIAPVVLAAVARAGRSRPPTGDPFGFVKRQWNGFSHVQEAASSTRLALRRRRQRPLRLLAGGARRARGASDRGPGPGQLRRLLHLTPPDATRSRPGTHSLEIRLLTHTGFVGFVLFAAFLVGARSPAALRAPTAARGLEALVAGAALLPLIVWLIHGSVDWFWEFPALSAPALGFLAMACALGVRPGESADAVPTGRSSDIRRTTSPGSPCGGPRWGAHDRRRSARAGGRRWSCSASPICPCGRFPRPRISPDQSGRGAPRSPHGCRSQPAERRSRPASAARIALAEPATTRRRATRFRAGDLARARRLVCVARGRDWPHPRSATAGAGPPRLSSGAQSINTSEQPRSARRWRRVDTDRPADRGAGAPNYSILLTAEVASCHGARAVSRYRVSV